MEEIKNEGSGVSRLELLVCLAVATSPAIGTVIGAGYGLYDMIMNRGSIGDVASYTGQGAILGTAALGGVLIQGVIDHYTLLD
jgi:hypothetical protein